MDREGGGGCYKQEPASLCLAWFQEMVPIARHDGRCVVPCRGADMVQVVEKEETESGDYWGVAD